MVAPRGRQVGGAAITKSRNTPIKKINGMDHYYIQEILGHRMFGDVRKYLIKWWKFHKKYNKYLAEEEINDEGGILAEYKKMKQLRNVRQVKKGKIEKKPAVQVKKMEGRNRRMANHEDEDDSDEGEEDGENEDGEGEEDSDEGEEEEENEDGEEGEVEDEDVNQRQLPAPVLADLRVAAAHVVAAAQPAAVQAVPAAQNQASAQVNPLPPAPMAQAAALPPPQAAQIIPAAPPAPLGARHNIPAPVMAALRAVVAEWSQVDLKALLLPPAAAAPVAAPQAANQVAAQVNPLPPAPMAPAAAGGPMANGAGVPPPPAAAAPQVPANVLRRRPMSIPEVITIDSDED